jgi:twitching motility two-component system response regulator PilG
MKKILIVDDSKTILHKASKILEGAGYDVATAVDGFDAITKVTDHRPDLMFVDIMMPKIDGYQTCSLIKNNHHYQDLPVVMVSSKDGLFDRARGSIIGAEGYINKPFDESDLLGAAKKYLSMSLKAESIQAEAVAS